LSRINTKKYQDFLKKNNIEQPFIFKNIKEGRNNKIIKVICNNESYIIKHYQNIKFKNLSNIRREFFFNTFLKRNKINCIPEPIRMNLKENFALYSFIDGKKIHKINKNHLIQASDFIKKININKEKYYNSKYLRIAVDGITEFDDHVNNCLKKIKILNRVKINSSIKKDFSNLLSKKIIPKYNYLIDNKIKIKNRKLKNHEYIISPSDFGFHNIINKKNKLYFFDFEYAGWDDPIKLICDFFCQPDYKLNRKQSDIFTDNLLNSIKKQSKMKLMIKYFMPFYRIKWCCIILNEFYYDIRKRRNHAGINVDEMLNVQLNKSKKYFNYYLND